ncbi:Ankyrin repeat-containing protein [Thalictrum thalictroides]|uniref:Ankyrin repeat-containing protein n=1 Tax=Thalictrum thalictroides TaxID=46969 RepID=A0A7J6WKL4_THATH|nr:Ankyrin repeat-containing protein [Thalictrum thalictroides]
MQLPEELRKLHREGNNNATNSVTVVVVLFGTIAFAATFTLLGGNDDKGMAVVMSSIIQDIFIVNAIALFTSSGSGGPILNLIKTKEKQN